MANNNTFRSSLQRQGAYLVFKAVGKPSISAYAERPAFTAGQHKQRKFTGGKTDTLSLTERDLSKYAPRKNLWLLAIYQKNLYHPIGNTLHSLWVLN